jgi:GTP cyclohydrolase II
MSREPVDRMLKEAAIDQPYVTIPTPGGNLRVCVVQGNGQQLLVATSTAIPDVPVVRFQSSCVFGESLQAIDCDCGAQLSAAIELICREGGILIYAWEEGRGAGIVNKIRAIALQQMRGLSTTQAFAELGLQADLRTFEAQVAALKQTFAGSRIRLASANPEKISVLRRAGYAVERVKLDIQMTPEREAYLAHKREYLGHLNDD